LHGYLAGFQKWTWRNLFLAFKLGLNLSFPSSAKYRHILRGEQQKIIAEERFQFD
jgi:hypothetical protein